MVLTSQQSLPVGRDNGFDKTKQKELIEKYRLVEEMRQEIQAEVEEIRDAILEVEDSSEQKIVDLSTIFDFPPTNSGITKEFCDRNKGNIPVYGCSKSGESVLGYIKENMEGVKYYSDCLTWNRNGSVGHFFFRNGLFSTNEIIELL